MSEPVYFKVSCGSCGGHIAYPDTSSGQTVACPHCGNIVMLQNDLPLIQVSTSIEQPKMKASVALTEAQLKELNERNKRNESRHIGNPKENIFLATRKKISSIKNLKDLHLLSDAGTAFAITGAILIVGLLIAGLIILAVYLIAKFFGTISPEIKHEIYSWVSSILLALGLLAVGLRIYFHPSVVASKRKHINVESIFILNLLLGWTFVGWVLSLVWAYKVKE